MWQFKQYDLDNYHIDIIGYIPSNNEKDQTNNNSRKEKKPSLWSELSQEQKDYYNRQRAACRTKSKVRRSIIKHNLRYMWTLTFKEKYFVDGNGNQKDAGNLKDVWNVWRAFIKRCKRKGLEFPYIVVLEVQEKRLKKYKQKVYHFHFCTNKFIHHSKETAIKYKAENIDLNMMDLWGYGVVYATNFKNDTKQAAAGYLTKYVTKAFEEIEEKGANRYRISEGLNVEGYIRSETTEHEMDKVVYDIIKHKNLMFKKKYELIDSQNEILIYSIFPKCKKRKNNSFKFDRYKNDRLDPNSTKNKKRWKSLESVPIKLPKQGEKQCQSIIKYSQLKLL